MSQSDNPKITFGTGVLLGLLILGLLAAIGLSIGLPTGMYGFGSQTIP